MNLILKIVQGINAGAEIALVEGVNVKLGRGDECDIELADQSLPEVACEIEVGAERVMLLLPGDRQERLEPLHVVPLGGTTAIAIGPADAPWGELVWPSSKTDDEKPVEQPSITPEADAPRRRVLWPTLVAIVAVLVVLELAVWFFWPVLNKGIGQARDFCLAKWREWTMDSRASRTPTSDSPHRSLPELAEAYQVELVETNPREEGEQPPPLLKGNLATRAERMELMAEAYAVRKDCLMELSDDESLERAATELLDMLTDGKLKLEAAADRRLALSGRLESTDDLLRVLQALQDDLPHLEDVDCSGVAISAPVSLPVWSPEQEATVVLSEKTEPPSVSQEPVEIPVPTPVPNLPVTGILTVPYPCLVLRDGSRLLEGAEFNGFVIADIQADGVLLKKGETMVEWRP